MPDYRVRKRVPKTGVEPYMQSNTFDQNAIDGSQAQREREYEELPSDQQELTDLNRKKQLPQTDIDNALLIGLTSIASLIPTPQQEKPIAPILESYNPNPMGTGSQAIFKKGGKIMEYFTGGTPPTGGGKGKKPKPIDQLRQYYDQRESQMIYG